MMQQIDKTIEVYEKLRRFTYQIMIENGEVINFKFLPENYHHIAGLQHLTDKRNLSNPAETMDAFYRSLKHDGVKKESIKTSQKYHLISERIDSFEQLLEIMAEGKGKIIVEFDKEKAAPSIIEAKFILYKRVGIPFDGNAVFYILFLGYDQKKKKYYPATYVVEHSNLYTTGQQIWNCEIKAIERHKKRKHSNKLNNK